MQSKFIFFLSIILMSLLYKNIGFSKMVINPTSLINEKGDIKPLQFELLNEASIEKTRGHAHSPFGVHGQNRYEYEGKIRIGRKVATIKTLMQPIAAFFINDQYFLLTNNYFNKTIFQWYELSNNNKFVELKLYDLNKSLFEIEFVEHDNTLLYRMWILKSCLNDNFEFMHNLLSKFVSDNPRFAYSQKWLPRKYTVFIDFISNLMDKFNSYPKKEHLFNDFVIILENSQPQDDPQDIRFICLLLLEIDYQKAQKIINEYIVKVRQDSIAGDNRLLDIEPVIEKMQGNVGYNLDK